MIPQLLPVLGNMLALPPLNSTAIVAATDFGSQMNQLAGEFSAAMVNSSM